MVVECNRAIGPIKLQLGPGKLRLGPGRLRLESLSGDEPLLASLTNISRFFCLGTVELIKEAQLRIITMVIPNNLTSSLINASRASSTQLPYVHEKVTSAAMSCALMILPLSAPFS
jgi:hypothetical protein